MIADKDSSTNWRIFTLYEVNIFYELSHKINDVVNVKLCS
jgi:hypothetical protein